MLEIAESDKSDSKILKSSLNERETFQNAKSSSFAKSSNASNTSNLSNSYSASDSSKLPTSVSARLGKLQFHLSGKFRVLQFADVQDAPKISKDTIKLIESACDAVRPDIVIFSGNQIAGYAKDFANTFVRRRWDESQDNRGADARGADARKSHEKDLQNTRKKVLDHIKCMVKPLEDRSIPWALTYGNHDFQCGLSNAELDSLYQEFSGCLNRQQTDGEFSSGSAMSLPKSILPNQIIFPCKAGTFALPVMDVNQEKVVFSIVLVDSGDYEKRGGYGSPSSKALDFLADLPNFLPPRFCVFQHFPLPQYYDLLREVAKDCAAKEHAIEGYRRFAGKYYALDDNRVLPDGYLGEGVSCPDKDSGEYDILQKIGAFAFCAGHDHRNAFAGRCEDSGMLLMATATCGFASYGPVASKCGARLLEFDIRHPYEPRTQMLEFGDLVGKASSKKAYTYGLNADCSHDLPEVDLLQKPSLFARILRRWRSMVAK